MDKREIGKPWCCREMNSNKKREYIKHGKKLNLLYIFVGNTYGVMETFINLRNVSSRSMLQSKHFCKALPKVGVCKSVLKGEHQFGLSNPANRKQFLENRERTRHKDQVLLEETSIVLRHFKEAHISVQWTTNLLLPHLNTTWMTRELCDNLPWFTCIRTLLPRTGLCIKKTWPQQEDLRQRNTHCFYVVINRHYNEDALLIQALFGKWKVRSSSGESTIYVTFVVSLTKSRELHGRYFKIGDDYSLQNTFHFIIYYHSAIRR